MLLLLVLVGAYQLRDNDDDYGGRVSMLSQHKDVTLRYGSTDRAHGPTKPLRALRRRHRRDVDVDCGVTVASPLNSESRSTRYTRCAYWRGKSEATPSIAVELEPKFYFLLS